jgi:hypothetical protein
MSHLNQSANKTSLMDKLTRKLPKRSSSPQKILHYETILQAGYFHFVNNSSQWNVDLIMKNRIMSSTTRGVDQPSQTKLVAFRNRKLSICFFNCSHIHAQKRLFKQENTSPEPKCKSKRNQNEKNRKLKRGKRRVKVSLSRSILPALAELVTVLCVRESTLLCQPASALELVPNG